MLKKISAALIAVSMLAAPAMAASTKSETAPVTKSVAPAAKLKVKPSVRNANAKMSRRHHVHYSHLRSHKKIGAAKTTAAKTNKVSKLSVKQAGAASKRG